MVRKVYRDFLRRKAAAGQLGWLLGLGLRYALTGASVLLRRPLCGPILGTLLTNYECNLRCAMCRLPGEGRRREGDGRRPLDTAGMLALVDGFADLGTLGIGFTGGEPLLRPDLFALLRRTRERGMLTHLNSNGTLVDGETARRIVEAGVDSLNLSLDGATEESHDRVRGVAGSFGRTVDAFRRVDRERKGRGSPLRLKAVAVLSDENVDEVDAYLRLAASLGADCVEFIPRQPFPEGAGRGTAAEPGLLARLDGALRLLSDREALPLPLENSPRMLSLFPPSFRGEPSPLPCHAGYNSLTVDCFGTVYPCLPFLNWGRPSGHLDGRSLPAFWRSGEQDRARRASARCRACTLNCHAELNLLFHPFLRLPPAGGT